jgi:hypothetical protein
VLACGPLNPLSGRVQRGEGCLRPTNSGAEDPIPKGQKTLSSGCGAAQSDAMDTTTNTTKDRWDEVGSLLTGLGLKLQLHVEQAASADKAEVTNAIRSLAESLEHAFEGLRAASNDIAIREDVKNVARSLSEAVGSTLNSVEEEIRDVMKKKD